MQALWMLVASFLFACMGVCVKWAAQTFAAIEIVFYRSFLSLLFMLVLVRWHGVSLRTPQIGWQIRRGLVGFLALYAYFYAITLLPLATAVTLNYTSAMFLAVYLLISGARFRAGVFGALFIGLVGVAVLLRPSLSVAQGWGGVVGLISGALAGMAYFSVRELGRRGEPEMRTVFYFSLVASLGSGIWLLLSGEAQPVDRHGIWILLGVAGFATLAQLAMTRAYSRGGTLLSAVLAYSTVVFSSAFGAYLWGEVMDLQSLGAMLLIVLSGIMASHYSRPR